MAIPFVSESRPQPGVAVLVAPGILRLTAPNGGPLTYHGTNTYVVATEEGNLVIDPGPDEATHIEALLELTRCQVTALLVTHGHGDHVDAAAAIAAATGAVLFAFPRSIAEHIRIDRSVGHGDVVHGLRVLHTPGHSPDHLCFARQDGVLFSGDHVMTWSTSAVSPPRGSMIDYRRSLSRLLEADYRLLLPGHGAPSHEPAALIGALLEHRLDRERQVLDCVKAGAVTPSAIADRIYRDLPAERRGPAERTVWAYLLSLAEAGCVRFIDNRWVVAG